MHSYMCCGLRAVKLPTVRTVLQGYSGLVATLLIAFFQDFSDLGILLQRICVDIVSQYPCTLPLSGCPQLDMCPNNLVGTSIFCYVVL